MRLIVAFLTFSSFFSILTGCIGDESADSSTDGLVGDTPGCECIRDEDDSDPPDTPSDPACGEDLCGVVAVSCDGYCDAPLIVSNPDAVTCSLTALRDRTPGVLYWNVTTFEGQFEDNDYLLINDDGTAVRRSHGAQDLSYVVGDATLHMLRDPAYFDDCLAETDVDARFSCLRSAVEPQTAVCDEGWQYDTF